MEIKTCHIDSKRLFVAITLPSDLRFLLFESIKNLAEKDLAIKLIAPEYIHLTLKFIGSTDISMLGQIESAISDTADSIDSFSFTAGNKIAAFPAEISSARILFVPAEDAGGKIEAVFKSLETNLAKIKIKKDERKFVAHITIARVRQDLNNDTADLIKNVSLDFNGSIACNKITLFESRLEPSGADYIILREFALK